MSCAKCDSVHAAKHSFLWEDSVSKIASCESTFPSDSWHLFDSTPCGLQTSGQGVIMAQGPVHRLSCPGQLRCEVLSLNLKPYGQDCRKTVVHAPGGIKILLSYTTHEEVVKGIADQLLGLQGSG